MKAYILNYDKNENAAKLYNAAVSCFDTYIVHNGADTAGLDHIADIGNMITCKPGYTNALVAANEHFLKSDSTHALYICSDVTIESEGLIEYLSGCMPKVNPHTGGTIGMVGPAIHGRCWGHMQPSQNRRRQDIRAVPFIEGICFMTERSIIEQIGTITGDNINGWGLDIYMGYLTQFSGKESVVIEDLTIYHPEGSSYSIEEARNQMVAFIKSKDEGFQQFCKTLGIV